MVETDKAHPIDVLMKKKGKDKKALKFGRILRGEYSNIEVISLKGGFSIVLKGMNLLIKRTEAIKAIDMTEVEELGMSVEKIEQEIEIMGRLDHPHIVKIHNIIRKVTEEEDYLFIIMEYCDSTLTQLIQSNPCGLPQEEALQLLGQIVDGVGYLHDKQILHRDLKPDNVFLKNGEVKIGDFNISKMEGRGETTRPSQVMLTLAYAPPERCLKQKGDQRMDLWAIGCLYYIMRFGSRCFLGDDHQQLTDNIIAISYLIPPQADEKDMKLLKCLLVEESLRPFIEQFKIILLSIKSTFENVPECTWELPSAEETKVEAHLGKEQNKDTQIDSEELQSSFETKLNQTDKRKFKIIMIGRRRTGKLNLLMQFTHNKFEPNKEAMSALYVQKAYQIFGENVTLCISDMPGNTHCREVNKIYYKKAQGAVVVYDVTDESSFKEAQKWVTELQDAIGNHAKMGISAKYQP